MRKWLIGAGALVVAAAVAATVWVVTRSDGRSRLGTASEAVEATCHANGASLLSPKTDPKVVGHDLTVVALRNDLIPVYWGGPVPKQPLWEAAVRATPSGGFEVIDCKVAQVAP